MSISSAATQPRVANSATAGALAGLAGGVVFGMLMGMMGMLVRQEGAVVGFLVHMLISAFIGAVYGIVAVRLMAGWVTAILSGMVNGAIWWVLGGLVLMPLGLGMTEMVFVIGADQWMSLMGHLLYGVVTALAFVLLSRRRLPRGSTAASF